jgi:hypothetical protein
MAVATVLVLGFTELAPFVGPQLSGLLATYPVFAAVLAAFAHRRSGRAAAMRVFRGLMTGLFSFAGFFVVLGTTIERLGVAPAFLASCGVAVLIQGASLWLMRRTGAPRRPRR